MSQATWEFHYRFVLPHGGGMEIDMLAVTNHTFPRECENALMSLGHRTLRLPPHPSLPAPVASHPDMLLFFAPDAILCTHSYYRIAAKELEEISLAYGAPIRCISEEYGSKYPADVLLNALPMGRNLICNTKTAAAELLTLEMMPHHVNQGYTKCAALPLGERALITSDASIATKARKIGIDVLQIQPGHISLLGYDYGFIGGCASFGPRAVPDSVFFCGDPTQHPDGEQIASFCKMQGFQPIYLTTAPLRDVGTIFMI